MTQRIDVERAEGDRAAVHAGHVRRLGAIDPLARVPALDVGEDETVLVARAGDGAAMGRVRVEVFEEDSEPALWGPLREIRLIPYLVGEDAGAAWDRLLTRWIRSLADLADAGDVEAGAMVSVAARDLVTARPLAHHGFAPLTSLAVRNRVRPVQPAAPDPRVRRADEGDLDAMLELAVALHRHDASFGAVTRRSTAARTLGASLEIQLERSPAFTWVVEGSDRRLAGYLAVQPPDRARWVSRVVAAEPVAYVEGLYVHPAARRAGIGAALVATAHRALDESGVAATLLHHALPSPVSTPFWAQHGYRPLWTAWQRRPAVAAPGA